MLNMNEYRIIKKNIDNIKYLTFDRIYLQIIEKIKLFALALKNECHYEIPFFLIGEPLYKMKDCIKYLMNSLVIEIQNGNIKKISFHKPNILIIKWDL